MDRFEQNDTPASATNLNTISGALSVSSLSLEANDDDWYRFSLASTARSGDELAINFNHALGDLDLYLYASDGSTLLDDSNGVSNQEQISLAGLPAGSYYAHVVGYGSASNPDYSLFVAATPATSTGDRFEQNDSAAGATNLGAINGTVTETSLSIESDDDDWYRFTLGSNARSGDEVLIDFNDALGDLDLYLYASDGSTLLDVSEGVSNRELISLAGLPADTYYARVIGYSGDSNPNYAFSIAAAPATATGDRFEQNDSAAAATELGAVSGITTESSLSLESNDHDWYRFTLGSAARSGDELAITFNGALGDLDLYLYASDGFTLLDASVGVDDLELIGLAGLPAGSYYAHVVGYDNDSNPNYALAIAAAPAVVADDPLEQNDTAATATDLRTIIGTVTQPSLSVESNDDDWYRFTLGAAARTGDEVSIEFNSALGDLDLYLYASDGTTLLDGSDGVSDLEHIGLAGLAAGSYYARVIGYDGASNPNYTLTVVAAPAAAARDRFENNDSAAAAADLRTINGTATETALTMEADDPDWYRFTLGSAARTGDQVSISFNSALGDLDLYLYASDQSTLLGGSDGVSNLEQISLSGLAAGTYYAQVVGYYGASNPDYALTVAAAQTTGLTADAWETNNTSAQATQIRQASQSISGATITANDQDWFAFTLPATGGAADRVTVAAAGGDLTVQLLNAQSQVVASVQTDANGQANLPLANVAAGSYFVNVAGAAATTQAEYNLDLRAAGTAQASQQGSWTILVYVDGDNNLEGAAVDDINEMEEAALRAGINVGVIVDRIPGEDGTNGNWTDTRQGVIVRDSNTSAISSPLTSLGEIDMGDRQTLINFLNWGATNLPAENYALVIWDHGGGTLYGSAFDDTSSGSRLTNVEVRQAIASSSLQQVDLLGFDACLMAAVELASEAAPVASTLVASELTEPGEGWDYTTFLTQFSASGQATPTALAGAIVDAYGNFFGQRQTLSAIDLSKTTPIEQAIDAFVATMRTATSIDWQAVTVAKSRAVAGDSDYDFYVDLGSFMNNLMTASANPAIDTAAQDVLTAIEASLLRKVGPSAFTGLTVVIPPTAAQFNAYGYTAANHQFVANTAWEDFLSLYLANNRSAQASSSAGSDDSSRSSRAGGDVAADFAETLDLGGNAHYFSNNTISTSYDLGQINQSDYRVPGLNIDTATDVDWFRFQLPTGTNLSPNVSIQVAEPTAGVTATLYNASQTVLGQPASSGSTGNLSFSSLSAGAEYYLEIRGNGTLVAPAYELRSNAFGSTAPADPLADFAEGSGGNNSMNKAYQLGNATQLADVGAIHNLSFNAADLQGGANGGDWFRVDAARTTETNANRVAISEVVSQVSNNAGDLGLRVYDINGQLLATSAAAGTSTESVTFALQVSDVYVQVYSQSGLPTTHYALSIFNSGTEGGPGNDTLVDATGGNSVFRGRGGDDSINGGSGIDTSAYDGAKASSTVTKTASGWAVSSAAEGTDTLVDLERLQFSDISVALDLGGNAGTVAKILGAVFGEESVGNEVYAGIGLYYLDQGWSYADLTKLAIDTALGANANHGAVVDLLYTNVAGIPPSSAERADFVALLDSNQFTVASLGVFAADHEINLANIELVGVLTPQGLEYVPYNGG